VHIAQGNGDGIKKVLNEKADTEENLTFAAKNVQNAEKMMFRCSTKC
jgi:hypothetical protein